MSDSKTVLIVEDEALIAMDIEEALTELGWRVIGPVPRTDQAMQLLKDNKVDIAVLDFNLAGKTSEDLAVFLTGKSIPVVFLSGDRLDARRAEIKHCEVVSKPTDFNRLSELLLKTLQPT